MAIKWTAKINFSIPNSVGEIMWPILQHQCQFFAMISSTLLFCTLWLACFVEPVMGGLGLNWMSCFLNPSFHFNFTHFWFLEASSFFFQSRLNFKLFSAFHALIAYTNVDSETEDTSQWEDCRGWERCSCWYPNEWFVAEMLMWPLVRQLLMRHLKLHATILWFDCWLHCKLYFMGNGILDLIY